ncbi:HD domain-containing phosphohydrolase [Emcibacter nanhaiensis]|uniref:PAS domain S-box protein n=1 Tax=Emcibacter nanhaiensis TaxID=1505037 RepID=A0A501PM58_9PROT|nr:HD domain-containing phosphohydrolase [Emcibacter nanhaiensis]TPD61513.1 PAS domain S-box protein [Emcibacter nanhaiensis]
MADNSFWKVRSAGTAISVLVLAAAVAAMIFAFRFAEAEKERDQLVWQNQMSVILAGRQAAIEEWLAEQTTSLQKLTDNAALRIYLAGVADMPEDQASRTDDQLAQMEYLGNQLKGHALRNGFVPPRLEESREIGASLDVARVAGLALTNAQGQVLVSTSEMPSVTRAVAAYMEAGAGTEPLVYGPYPAENAQPVIAFVAPVYGVQEDEDSAAIGFAVGIKLLDQGFFRKLNQPGDMSRTARTYLVRDRAGVVQYLSPVEMKNGDVNAPLTFMLDEKTPSLAASFVLENPGGFAERINYEGDRVLVTGRQIAGTDWSLVRTVDSTEVLGRVETRRRNILWISGLIILTVTVLLLLIWRHGVSVRVSQAAERQRVLAAKYEKLSHFMEVVTDSQPTSITAVDEEGHYTFANRQAEKEIGMARQDIIGQPLKKMLEAAAAREAAAHCQEVLDEDRAVSTLLTREDGRMTLKADYLPLNVGGEKGVLMVMEDLTQLVRERERREQALKNLIQTLTMIIDSRDPYSANHSARVAEVAGTIAREMECDDVTVETVEIAGALMNLGKILVPREVLTRPGELSSEELMTVRESIQKSADMLEGLDFEGPVVETLRQIRAHWDGSGMPAGLAGEDILLSARIVAVANAFVAMVSSRAHRPGLDMEESALVLMNDAEKIYDRRPVSSLLNYLENRGGIEQWKSFGVFDAPVDEA